MHYKCSEIKVIRQIFERKLGLDEFFSMRIIFSQKYS